MHYYNGLGYHHFGLFGFLWPIILILFIVWIVVMVVSHGGTRRWRHFNPTNSALSILNERFAKGEISKEEYEERKKSLLS